MDSPGDIMRLCRLCLVKDQVNVPIFEDKGDIKKIFLKISSCLPVKVSRDDKLPKKICDGCSNKLDMLYEFWTTAANAEKTLLSWLGQAGVKDNDADETMSAVAQQIQKPAEPYVKQETLDPEAANNASEVGDHFLLQNFMQKFSYNESASTGPSATVTSNAETDEPPPKRARRTAAVKAQINISAESDEDDDNDAMEPMTKVEDESDDSDGEDREPAYVDVPGTSGADDDQPGPSGVGKDGVEAPFFEDVKIKIEATEIINGTSDDDIKPTNANSTEFYCHVCNIRCIHSDSLRAHLRSHFEPTSEPIRCDVCGQEFRERPSLDSHVLKYHTDDADRRFVCSICGTGFAKDFDHKAHMISRHEKKKLAVCNVCGAKFYTKHTFEYHMKTHSQAEITRSELPKEKPNRSPPPQIPDDRKFHCGICGKSFKRKRDHVIHMASKHQKKLHVCVTCGMKFYTKHTLEAHVKTHPEDERKLPENFEFYCKICGVGFRTSGEHEEHKALKHEKKLYVCKVCGTKCFTQHTYEYHLNTHDGETRKKSDET